ncbi:type VII secretion integral membrane protein EccD [Streptacidiphilus jiangxiensis]|uniref:Type VII secretion integral membrane protein EccD n=1 Tax=Streptacidiphilus jiangxiensis TaxID=235985 RepID=A0A1H7P5W6_STRJI|nr:type VII secretion integral membrane protein EccD [Streptacidiphilus jiangxiensis]SEL31172.1 type VII secretion integral membrane protein EccD [Streptacidiphilus jiangxiensis]
MTTIEPVLSAEVCRVTVVGPKGQADLAVPVSLTVSALLPALLARVEEATGPGGVPWVLQRLGEDPLDPDATPDSIGLRDGEVLHLRPAEAPLPALQFDDLADGVAHVLAGRADRWQPQHTRRLAVSVAALTLGALLWALLGFGPGAAAAGTAGGLAVLLAAAAVAGDRLHAGQGPVVLAGTAALLFAAAAGLTFRAAPQAGHTILGSAVAFGGYAPGEPGVLVAAGAVAALAAALLGLRPLPVVIPATALVVALAAGIGALLVRSADLPPGQATAVVAVALFVLGHFGPRLTLRMARLRVPQLPHNAEELQQDIDPEPLERVERRVTAAHGYLNTLSLASALVYAAGLWCMVRETGWIGWVLPLAFCGAVLLRSRGLTSTLQRVPMVLAGALGLALLLVVRGASGHHTARGVVVVVLLVAAVALLVAAWRLPSSRLLPVWAHSGDLLETLSAVALLPLLLQAVHAYAWFRSLAS